MQPKKTTIFLHVANLLQSCIDKKAHLSGKLIHAYVLRNGLFNDTFLSNRLIEFYSKCNNPKSAQHLFDQMPRRDIFSWNAILSAQCRAQNLELASKLFDEMPERNVVSWNNVITALVRKGFEEKALRIYSRMTEEGYLPTNFTLASVLSACAAVLDVVQGRRCHGLAVKIGLDKNIYVGNALLCVYAKCGWTKCAVRVFGEMDEPNEVSFTTMMGGLALTDRVGEALEMFRLMCRKGVCIDSVSLSSVLGVCARGGSRGDSDGFVENDDGFFSNVHGKQVHCLTIKLGFKGDLHLSNSLLDMYAKNGDMDSAEVVFANLSEVSVVSWNVMIAGYGQRYESKKAVECLKRMQVGGFEPDEVTYINMLAACVKSGDIETGREMFDSMLIPSVSSWNAMISGYSQNENHKEAIKLFREMQFRGLQPDRTTLAIILSSCSAMGFLEAGKQIHAVSQKDDFHIDNFVASGLIGVYSKCQKIELAELIFSKMPELDIVCWNSMIAGYTLNSQDREALIFFKQMRKNEMFPTQFSFATVLSCCAKLSYSFQGRQVHAQIEKDGCVNDVFVGSALIDMYCKCGDVDGARKFFDMMHGKNSVTWNEMIHGYAQNGYGDEAICLYKNMIASGEKPDDITFVAVLTACSHSGLVDAGVEIFNSMKQEHHLEPKLDHYTCMVDCLGRAGRFHEAEMLIDEMPYKDDPVIWEVLLSSCRVHSNISLAKRAAEELFRLDPKNSATYSLLVNIYSSLGRWEDLRAVRQLMNENDVVKDPGYSWI
ncbi:pentatricopeptide repeat-containing protein At4g20770-like [Mangifera indica]|uniref:pentatricopeptide repeat-containing protein At4g20770-like n=1 Tax=Mangifera indica TaxID=29780 RepID=UPI001CF9693D|nr:pentatricopeptide repeat-containing protein At4g20770-like [Mangifera indica]XP_044508717.1 pentatricopeptide repeat-containing protein At4g20770-like [Mangifera indica]